MQVRHALAPLLSHIAHHPVAVLQVQLPGQLGDDGEDVAHDFLVFRGDLADALDVLLGDHQNVHRRLGVDVVKGKHLFVFIGLLGGDFSRRNLAEQTIHGCTSFLL